MDPIVKLLIMIKSELGWTGHELSIIYAVTTIKAPAFWTNESNDGHVWENYFIFFFRFHKTDITSHTLIIHDIRKQHFVVFGCRNFTRCMLNRIEPSYQFWPLPKEVDEKFNMTLRWCAFFQSFSLPLFFFSSYWFYVLRLKIQKASLENLHFNMWPSPRRQEKEKQVSCWDFLQFLKFSQRFWIDLERNTMDILIEIVLK